MLQGKFISLKVYIIKEERLKKKEEERLKTISEYKPCKGQNFR